MVTSNIFFRSVFDDRTTGPGLTCASNVFLEDTGSLAGACSGTLTTDPLFVDAEDDDFCLQDGSPAKGTGVSGEDRGAYPSGCP